MTTPTPTTTGPRTRDIADCSHDYLVERHALLEAYLQNLLEVISNFHPYLVPALNECNDTMAEAQARLEARYPHGTKQSSLVLAH